MVLWLESVSLKLCTDESHELGRFLWSFTWDTRREETRTQWGEGDPMTKRSEYVTALTGGGFMVWWWIKGSAETCWRWCLTAGWKQSHCMTALVSLLHTRLTLLLYFQIREQQARSHHLCGPRLLMFVWKSSNFSEISHNLIYWTWLFCSYNCAYVGTSTNTVVCMFVVWNTGGQAQRLLFFCSAPSKSLPYFTHDSIRLQLNDECTVSCHRPSGCRSVSVLMAPIFPPNDICSHSHMTSPCVN